MAEPSAISREEKLRLLRLYLSSRGWDEQSIRSHIASLPDEAALAAEFDFHHREDVAVKRGAPLPPAEVMAHYTGSLHGMPLPAASSQVAMQNSPRAADQSGVALTAPRVAGGFLVAAALGVFVWALLRDDGRSIRA